MTTPGLVQWHYEARQMRAAGASVQQIANFFGKTFSAVQFALDEHNARERHRQRCAAASAKRPKHIRSRKPKPRPSERLGIKLGRVVERYEPGAAVNRITLPAIWDGILHSTRDAERAAANQ